jgi:prepilin-type N-terminal cleavage/methylation domain-containing protein
MLQPYRVSSSRRGFTLLETLLAVFIAGIMSIGISMTIQQMISVDSMNKTRLTTVKQVENAIFYLSRDVQMAQTVQLGPNSGFPLTLRWTEWDNTTSLVVYSVGGNQLQRTLTVNSDPATTLVLARNIDPASDQTNIQYSSGTLTGKVTAAISGFKSSRESRPFQIICRTAK